MYMVCVCVSFTRQNKRENRDREKTTDPFHKSVLKINANFVLFSLLAVSLLLLLLLLYSYCAGAFFFYLAALRIFAVRLPNN